MLNRIRGNKPEFLLAILIFITCSSCSIYIFLKLYPQILDSNSFNLSEIKEKTSGLYLLNKNNKCIGSSHNTLTSQNQNISYQAKTKLKISANGTEDILHINTQSVFNPLHQMVASVINLNGLDSEIIIGILNVNPAELSLSYNKRKQSIFKKKISLPGPFMLKKINNQLFVEHQPTGKSVPLDISTALFSALNLNVIADSSEEQACPQGSTGTLDISALSRQLEMKLQNLNPDLSAGMLNELLKNSQAK